MLQSFQRTWKNLPVAQRVALGGGLAVVFAGILLGAWAIGRPSYGVLFSNLEADDAGAVTAKLRDLKTDYRLSQEGRTIEVPADQVYDLRLSMATEGLPRGGTVGFELFDKTRFGATDFTEHLNYQRALQGELTRTINQLDGVTESRIHLAMPERRLFSEAMDPVTASVVLHLRSGYQLDDRRVGGIVHLVSSAVEGLKPENVTVHDAQGELLSSGGTSPLQTSSQVQMQERYERRLEAALQRLAEQVVGPGRAAVRVSADFNWDATETTSETYAPSRANGKSLAVEEQSTTESYGRRPDLPAQGVPGVTSNLDAPVAGRLPGTGALASRPGDPGQYRNSQVNNRYALNKVVERRVASPGKIRRLSIAVLLDRTIGRVEQRALKEAFAAAAGLDLQSPSLGGRGDRIELLPMPFDRSSPADATRAAAAAAQQSARMAQTRVIGIASTAAILLSIAAFVWLRRRAAVKQARAARQPLDVLLTDGAPEQAPFPTWEAPEEPEERNGAAGRAESKALTVVESIRLRAAEHPEEVARQLQIWMAE